MESSLVSWQFENFSSAEFVSPPVSPSPPSPSLFELNGAPSSPIDKKFNGMGKSIMPSVSAPISRRAQIASNILNDLEQLREFTTDINDLGMNWNEESISLGLFEELEEIEYTPPASPTRSSTVTSHDLGGANTVNVQFRQSVIAPPPPTDISALTAEFQAILESLPKDNTDTDALCHVLEIAGIPTTIIDGEALVPVELDLTSISPADLQSLNMDVDDFDVNAISDDDVIEESELYGLSDMSSQGSPAGSEYETAAVEVVDHHSDAAQKILDALLKGDVTTAEAYLPDIVDSDDDSSMSSEDSICLETLPGPSRSVAEAPKKPERRGRKPGKKLVKGSPTYIKDKSLRKKEQNKTAATRYRQKKKLEFAVILDNEADLQSEHDELEKKKADLAREILMVKQLLREVIKARKPAESLQGKSIAPLAGKTASILVRNRRK